MSAVPDKVRLDKWLWCARFFRTRSLATTAVEAGRVQVNDERAKPAKAIRVGDRLDVRIGAYRWRVVVHGVAERRGPAAVARTLYAETEASLAERLERVAQIRAARPSNPLHRGRPTKKLRRDFDRGESALDRVLPEFASEAEAEIADQADDRWLDPEAWDDPDEVGDAEGPEAAV